MTTTGRPELDEFGRYKFGWHDPDVAGATARRGLNEDVVREISMLKNEPEWMLKLRLKGLRLFGKKPMPTWGSDLSGIDFDNIKYFVRSTEKQAASWDELPADIKNTYDKLGIPEAEKQRLIAGVAAQYECLASTTRVWTANRGQVTVKEIQPGDVVFSYDEDERQLVLAPVRAAAQTGTKQLYRLRAGTREVAASDNHPFLARVDGETRWVPLSDLCVGDLVAVPGELPQFGAPVRLAPEQGSAFGPLWTSPELMWLLGVFLGAGSARSGQGVRFAVDGELRPEVTRLVNLFFGLRVVRDGADLVVEPQVLVEWLAALGFFGDDFAQRIPAWVFEVPVDERLAFLAGWVDADAFVGPARSATVVIASADRALLEQAGELAELSGLHAIGPDDIDRAGFGLVLDRGAEQLGRFARRLADRPIAQHAGDALQFVPVESIVAGDVEPVWDVEVDGPHNFVAEGLVVHNSEVVYHKIRDDLEQMGVLFLDTDTALREHEDLFREYFATVIPPGDNKFAALNTATWSGGSFIYVPPGVNVEIPLQAYFRINTENMGQFERTLIIVDEGSYVHYVEGCTAPIYSSDSLHSAVVEIVVKKNARARYTTIQNWSNNVYNLVTKRAVAQEGATMEWIDGNIGCLAEGSTVTTPSGVKPIEELIPGERVLSYDEGAGELVFRRVMGKRYSGEQPVREVCAGQRRLRVTDNHPFFSYAYDPTAAKKSGRYRLSYVRADKVSEAIVPVTSLEYGEPHKLRQPDTVTTFASSNQWGAQFVAKRSRAPRLNLPDTTTDDVMWLFGAFVGDGSMELTEAANGSIRWAKVVFSIPATDRARERLVRVMADLLPGVAPTERADGVTVTWNSVELAELLLQNGFRSGARGKRVPDWVLGVPESQRLAFLAGYLDTDGCAAKGRRGFSIKSVSTALLQDVSSILVSLGISGRLYSEFDDERSVVAVDRQVTAHGAHRLEFPVDRRLLGHVSAGLRDAASRQTEPAKRHFRKVGRSNIELPASVEIRKVQVSEPLETVPTWDIEVEGTGNFVSQGFIVHNSKVTMKYPAVWLVGEHARGETLSVAFAGEGQHQDAGAKMVHAAPHTSSNIVSKSVARAGGRTSYRGLVQVQEGSHHSRATVKCDALLVDQISRSDTYPYVDVREDDVSMGHEATVSKVSEDQLFYLMSRGLSEEEAMAMIVRGFVEPIARELPMEYALELNRLIELQMEGSVG